MFRILIVMALFTTAFLTGEEVSVGFVPPEGWHFAEKATLPKSVQVMVVGKGLKEFPPSINLTTEPYEGTARDYLKIVQALNSSHGNEWKDLGTIHTEAGDASLSQSIQQTEWGKVQMMHAILANKGTIYILTAAALKDDFQHHYKEFFEALRSLHFDSLKKNS